MGYKVTKRKDSKNYYIIGMIHRVRIVESLHTTNKRLADVLADKIYSRKLAEITGFPLITKNKFRDFMARYLEFCQANNKLTTADRKKSNATSLIRHFGDMYLEEITPSLIERFKEERLRSVKPASVNRDIATLKHAFSKAVEWGYLRTSPATRVKKLKEPTGRTRYLTKEEAAKLIRQCNASLRFLVLAALSTGMRLGELLALRWEDIDMSNRSIHVINSKSHLDRHIPILDELFKVLEAIKDRQVSVFTNESGEPYRFIHKIFNGAVRRAGIKDFTFHDLRHTFASWLVMAGEPLYNVQRLLGHSTITMTQRYAHLSQDHLRDTIQKLSQNLHSLNFEVKSVSVTT